MAEGKGYCINAKNILCHEMIGLFVKAKPAGKNGVAIEGKIVDETKNAFMVEIKGDEKMIAKNGTIFEFMLGKEVVAVRGSDILYRPEQRIKALWRFC